MKIVFMGTPQAAVPTLKRIIDDGHEVVAVWTQPDRPSGRGNKLKAPPVKEFALENDIEVFQPTKIRNKKSIALFKSHEADVAVVVAYGRILSKSYLNAFPMGCINVHFSLLPKYRGAAPVNWVIVNGEVKTGISTMQMDLGLDTGDILLQSETDIGERETTIDLMNRLAIHGAELLSKTLTSYDGINPLKQNHEMASLAPIMSKGDGVVDWNKNAFEIANQVRGFQPFPKSFTTFKGEKITIWNAIKYVQNDDLIIQSNTVGEILYAQGDELIIACGNSTYLKVIELQIAGKRRMKTRDFLNGMKFNVGDVLG